MEEVWQKYYLDDIAISVQPGPFGTQLHSSDYSDSGTPVVMPTNMQNGKINPTKLVFVNDEHVQRLSRHQVKEGDILFARKGDVKKAVYITENEAGWLTGSDCLKVELNKDLCYPKFIFYFMQSPLSGRWLEKNSIGATMPSVNSKILGDIEIRLPKKETQIKISEILSAYDDLIENNNKQIKLLEEAAQRLYKEWFVKFNFPGHENTKIVAGVPEGWEYKSLKSLVDFQNGYAFKSDSFDETGEYRLITIKNVKDGAFDYLNVNKIKVIPSGMQDWCKLEIGDSLVSLTGNVGRVCLVTAENCLLNQRVAKIACTFPSYAYVLFRSKDMFNIMNKLAKGAAQQNLSPIQLGEEKILMPENHLIKRFDQIVEPFVKEIICLNRQNQEVQSSRDKLLPKLMNQEIEVTA